MLLFVEDVGPPQRDRHHRRLDVDAGQSGCAVEANKVFYTTGRLTSEMVIKSAQMGVPIVVSRSGITQMGHEVAQAVGPVRHRPRHQQAFSLLLPARSGCSCSRNWPARSCARLPGAEP